MKTEYTAPLTAVVVEITNRCNLRCAHCASNSGQRRAFELSVGQWQTVFDDLRTLGTEDITLIGGEIFLHPDWYKIVSMAKDAGMVVSIVTNGLLLKQYFPQLVDLDIDVLGVSLDGASPKVYQAVRGVDGFETVWAALNYFRDNGNAPVTAITTISRLNVHDLDNLADLLRGSGIDWQVQFASCVSNRFESSMMLSPAEYGAACRQIGEMILAEEKRTSGDWILTMDDFGYFPIDPIQARLHMHWDGCKAGSEIAGIRANGDVLGCLSLGDPFVEANLLEKSLVNIWRSPIGFYKFRNKPDILTGHCRSCPKSSQCVAGCPCMAWSAAEEIGENPYCLRHVECTELATLLQNTSG